EHTTTSPPCFSLSRSASSSAYASGSFISKAASWSRTHVFASFSRGCESRDWTCFIQTAIFIGRRRQTLRSSSSLKPFEQERGVRAAEAERVRQRVLDLHRALDLRDVVEVAVLVRAIEVHGRGRDLVVHGKRGDARLQTSGGTEQVSGHRLGGRHGQLRRVGAKTAL